METALSRPPRAGTETKLFIVHSIPWTADQATLNLRVMRMDGLPETDRFGERLRSDRKNWLTLRQALALVETMMGGLPRY